jgi:hypothetical protein
MAAKIHLDPWTDIVGVSWPSGVYRCLVYSLGATFTDYSNATTGCSPILWIIPNDQPHARASLKSVSYSITEQYSYKYDVGTETWDFDSYDSMNNPPPFTVTPADFSEWQYQRSAGQGFNATWSSGPLARWRISAASTPVNLNVPDPYGLYDPTFITGKTFDESASASARLTVDTITGTAQCARTGLEFNVDASQRAPATGITTFTGANFHEPTATIAETSFNFSSTTLSADSATWGAVAAKVIGQVKRPDPDNRLLTGELFVLFQRQ